MIHRILKLKHTEDGAEALELFDLDGVRHIRITDVSGSAIYAFADNGDTAMLGAAIQQPRKVPG